MPKKLHTTVPQYYRVCLHADCKKAGTCLHQIAYNHLIADQTYLELINPTRCKPDGQCPFFRDCAPVRFARGFAHFQKRMFPEQYDRFAAILMQRFGRNPYYERRRGDTALPPSEQRLVLDTLRRVGVTEEMKFESYEEAINWYD